MSTGDGATNTIADFELGVDLIDVTAFGGYTAISGPARSERTPTYRQIDVRVEKVWLYNTWSLGLYLDVINVANLENVEAFEYDYRFKNKAPVTSYPILPTLGLRGTW